MSNKNAVRSKLNMLGVALIAGGVLEPAQTFAMELINLLPEDKRGLAVSALGLAIVILRTFFTSTSVNFKAPIFKR